MNNINALKGKILGIEMEMDIVEADLAEISNQLKFLIAMQCDLIYNLKLLRSPHIVATINGYSQSMIQLKEVQTRIIKIRNTRYSLIVNLDKLEKTQEITKEELDMEYSILNSEKKILLFKRRK